MLGRTPIEDLADSIGTSWEPMEDYANWLHGIVPPSNDLQCAALGIGENNLCNIAGSIGVLDTALPISVLGSVALSHNALSGLVPDSSVLDIVTGSTAARSSLISALMGTAKKSKSRPRADRICTSPKDREINTLKCRISLLEEELEAVKETRSDEAEERLRDTIVKSGWRGCVAPVDF